MHAQLHVCTHTHTCPDASPLSSRMKSWMMDGFAMYSRPNRNPEFSHPAPPIPCTPPRQEACAWHRYCGVNIFSHLEIKEQVVLVRGQWDSYYLSVEEENQRYRTTPSAPGRVWLHPAQRLHSLYGCVLPERLKNGRHQSRSEELLPSSCTVKLILIEIDYSIWDTRVINF